MVQFVRLSHRQARANVRIHSILRLLLLARSIRKCVRLRSVVHDRGRGRAQCKHELQPVRRALHMSPADTHRQASAQPTGSGLFFCFIRVLPCSTVSSEDFVNTRLVAKPELGRGEQIVNSSRCAIRVYDATRGSIGFRASYSSEFSPCRC